LRKEDVHLIRSHEEVGESHLRTFPSTGIPEGVFESMDNGRPIVFIICYGRLAVVSDVDDGGFALNVNKELRGSAVLYRSKYNGAMLESRWT
jgi:hypothetical protein